MFRRVTWVFFAILFAGAAWAQTGTTTSRWKIVGWNDLGMHCVDGIDYSVFSILPPYNNIHAQVIDSSGRLVKTANGISVTYQAVADPTGSINTTSRNDWKTNFWLFAGSLFKLPAPLAPDMGLAGFAMPGLANTPRPMRFDTTARMFAADGVPITPYDDARRKNYYPLMRLTARDSRGAVLATTDIVLPVSDEMDCAMCHASGSTNTARPSSGWVFVSDPLRDYKLNILKLHDDRHSSVQFKTLLATVGYKPDGLLATSRSGTPILCARCHLSNALPGSGYGTITPLTSAVHSRHAGVTDPLNQNFRLDDVNNRTACYRCHPGSVTACLRGVMGNAKAADGSMLMQCQSCHGSMSTVGARTRTGWLQQPNCQACHTGTATQNNGQIRYTSVFEPSGLLRQAVNTTFATTPNAPAAGFSLYRMSAGHGGLQCEACHGSTHAEYPSSHTNDNLQSIRLQGHAGTLAECNACHTQTPQTVTGGPHGMHPVGQSWVSRHGDTAERNASQCRTCHGLDYRGTELSRVAADRVFSGEDIGTKRFPAGTRVGCYSCHNGPRGD